jgi:large subunit ribosomal protein L17
MRKLGRKSDNRNHLLRNLVTSLLMFEKVETTTPKAKEIKSVIDRIISKAKADTLASKRYVFDYVFDKNAAKKVIEVYTKRYATRISGFTTLKTLKPRLGDNAKMTRIEMIDREKDEIATEKAVAKKTTEGKVTTTVRSKANAKA